MPTTTPNASTGTTFPGRKGVPIKVLSPAARAAAHGLIKSGLSTAGYHQAVNVMSLDDVLFLLETGDWSARRERRDPLNYSLTVFGTPSDSGLWGWRLEGHHLSLNYSVKDGRVIASTPEFFGCNPALDGRRARPVHPRFGSARGPCPRDCAHSTPANMKTAIASPHPPNDVWNAAKHQPEIQAPQGLAAADMTADQRTLLKQLLGEYLKNMPADVRTEREARITSGGFERIRLAWWGSLESQRKARLPHPGAELPD